MEKVKLEVNDRIEIERNDVKYKSKIQNITNENIFIDIPLYNNDYLILQNAETVRITTYGKERIVFRLDCEVIGRAIDGNIRVYKLAKPHIIKKIQRRNYVRVKITRIIKCIKEDRNFDSLLLDLSGGGMRLKASKELIQGDEIIAVINNNQKEVTVKGKIVRIEDDSDLKYNIIGVEFIEIHNKEREAIIQIVFEIMRKQIELI